MTDLAVELTLTPVPIEETPAPSTAEVTPGPTFQDTPMPTTDITPIPVTFSSAPIEARIIRTPVATLAPTVEQRFLTPAPIIADTLAPVATSAPTISLNLKTGAPNFYLTVNTEMPTASEIDYTFAPTADETPEDVEYEKGGKDLGYLEVAELKAIWQVQNGTEDDDAVLYSATADDRFFIAQGTGSFFSRNNRFLENAFFRNVTGSITVSALDSDSGGELWLREYNSVSGESVFSLYATEDSILVIGSTLGNWFGMSTGGHDLFLVELNARSGDIVDGFLGGLTSANFTGFAVYGLNLSTTVTSEIIIGGTVEGEAFVGRFSIDGEQIWRIGSSEEVTATVACHVDENFGIVTALQSSVFPRVSPSETDTKKTILKRIQVESGSISWTSFLEDGVGTSLAVSKDGIMVTVGYLESDILVRAYNSSTSNTAIWEYTSREGWGNSVALTTLGGHPVIVGSAPSSVKGRVDMDVFVLTLSIYTGEELCYYTFGSTADDEATSVVANEELRITVSGFTTGDLFNTSQGKSDVFAVSLDQSQFCTIPYSSAPALFQDVDTGTRVFEAINVVTAISATGVVATAVAGPTVISASTGFQVGSSATVGGTMTGMVVGQMQFMATTNLVKSNQSKQFSAFSDNLQWMNLWWSADVLVQHNECIANDRSGIGGPSFVGNTILVFGITMFIYIVHVVIVSAIEGYWLAKDNARHHYNRTSNNGQLGRHGLAPSTQEDDDEEEIEMDSSSNSSKAAPIATLTRSDRKVHFNEETDEPMSHVLQRSRSFWLHFPHIELLFLLFAYEGAVAAEASVLQSECIELVIMAAILLLLYPVLVLYLAWHVVQTLNLGAAVFITKTRKTGEAKSCNEKCTGTLGSMCSALKRGWTTGQSMFSYADLGHWEVPRTLSDDRDRIGRQSFMMAYEPMFRDFTSRGVNYILVLLARLMATSMVAALVQSGPIASFTLFFLYISNLVLVIVWQPFANTFMHFAETCALGINSMCLLLMWIASLSDNNPTRTDVVFGVYLMLQCVNVFILVTPVYIDFVLVLIGRLNKKISKKSEKKKVRQAGLRIRKRDIFRYWKIMIGHNIVAMISSLKEGNKVRREHPPRKSSIKFETFKAIRRGSNTAIKVSLGKKLEGSNDDSAGCPGPADPHREMRFMELSKEDSNENMVTNCASDGAPSPVIGVKLPLLEETRT